MEQVAPKNYQIHLIPDMTNFTFAGKVTLLVDAPAAIEAIGLNILELSISSCAVEQNTDWVECAFETDVEKEELLILLPQKMQGRSVFRFAMRVKSTIKWPGSIGANIPIRVKPDISL